MSASVLGLISSLRIDGRNSIQSVKSAQSVLHAQPKARGLPPLGGNHIYLIQSPTIPIIVFKHYFLSIYQTVSKNK